MAEPTCEIWSVWNRWTIGKAIDQWKCKSNWNIEFTRLRSGYVCYKNLYSFGGAVTKCSKEIRNIAVTKAEQLPTSFEYPGQINCLVPPTRNLLRNFSLSSEKASPWSVASHWSTSKIFRIKERHCTIEQMKSERITLRSWAELRVKMNVLHWSKEIEEFF